MIDDLPAADLMRIRRDRLAVVSNNGKLTGENAQSVVHNMLIMAGWRRAGHAESNYGNRGEHTSRRVRYQLDLTGTPENPAERVIVRVTLGTRTVYFYKVIRAQRQEVAKLKTKDLVTISETIQDLTPDTTMGELAGLDPMMLVRLADAEHLIFPAPEDPGTIVTMGTGAVA